MSPGSIKRRFRKGSREYQKSVDMRAASYLKAIQADYVRRHTSEEQK